MPFGVKVLLLFVFSAGLTFGALAIKAGTTFNVVSAELKEFLGIEVSRLPQGNPREEDRVDILLLGLRGENDPHGGLLTDTMMIVSIETDKNEIALISIPRDTYVEIPVVEQHAKINSAYALGEEAQESGGGLVLAKLAVQEVLGINIDHVIAVDFAAFEDTIDLLGGIDVDVARPLRETQQWGGLDFYVPAGRQHMDGETALYYVRARFTTSDFDRARRQQEVIVAMRDKALTLNFLGNPAKIVGMLDILGRHVRTDINGDDLRNLIGDVRSVMDKEPKRLVLDTTELLYSTSVGGAYVLLPQGNSFEPVRARARNIFEAEAPETNEE
jgi:LCP family protein required for cell wall assembly